MEQSLTLQHQQQQQFQPQQQQQTSQVLNLSGVESDLAGNGVGDPMAHPDQAALVTQQLPQQQQQQQQPPQQEAVVLEPNLYNLIEGTLAATGVDDPNALPDDLF